MWDMWGTKWHWSRFSPSTPASHDNSHSTNRSTLTNHPIFDAIQSRDWQRRQTTNVTNKYFTFSTITLLSYLGSKSQSYILMPSVLLWTFLARLVTQFLIFFLLLSWDGVRMSLLGKSATIWHIVPVPNDSWVCELAIVL
jgi:hypothetical protein